MDLYGEPQVGDDETVFFVFRRERTTPETRRTLPRETTLQRAILERLEAGGHWYVRHGQMPLDDTPRSRRGATLGP